MAVNDRPALMVCGMSCIGVQMHEGRGHRAQLHRQAHQQNQTQAFHGCPIVSHNSWRVKEATGVLVVGFPRDDITHTRPSVLA